MSIEAYEKQEDKRMCGAAALNMTYRRLGKPATQQEIWRDVARMDETGQPAARTYLLAKDAIARGFVAAVFEAKNPWQVIQSCFPRNVQLIVNHRSRLDTWRGHYSVIDSVAGGQIVLHDPQFGPNRIETRDSLLALMQRDPKSSLSEITGNVIVAVAADPGDGVCPTCKSAIPETVECPGCGSDVPFRPSAALQCADATCGGRLWQRVFCPFCDYVVLGGTGAAVAATAGAGAGAPAGQVASPNDKHAFVFSGMQSVAESVLPAAPPEMREYLGGLLSQRKELIGKLRDKLPGMVEEAKAIHQHCEKLYEESAKEAGEAENRQYAPTADAVMAQEFRKAAQAKKSANISKPALKGPAANTPLDGELGERLRQTLIKEMAGVAAPAPTTNVAPQRSFESWTHDPSGAASVASAAGDSSAAAVAQNEASEKPVSSFESWFNAGTAAPTKDLPDGTSTKPPEDQWKEWLQRARPSGKKS